MRGSLQICTSGGSILGIIPAHAGLTLHTITLMYRSRDHPRACGAHAILMRTTLAREGSSPRMRGSRSLYLRARRGSGIIPAHAGLTALVSSTVSTKRDHPRACGAHRKMPILLPLRLGSSPRMRGSRSLYLRARRGSGIIPAHAGLTALVSSTVSTKRDHPRACGAHRKMPILLPLRLGSSPRMRGSRHRTSH